MSEEIVSATTNPNLPSTSSGVVPALLGFAFGIGVTVASTVIANKLKKAKAEKIVVVVPEETPKTD